MKRTAILLSTLCFCAVPLVLAAQQSTTPKTTTQKSSIPTRPNVAGTWEVTNRLQSGPETETWTVKQAGDKISGTVKTASGQEFPIEGEMVPPGYFFRVTVKFPDGDHLIRATADSKSMDGSITIGKGEHLWSAKKVK